MSETVASEIGILLEDITKKVSKIVESSKDQMEKILISAKKNVENGIFKSGECESILDEVLKSFEIVDQGVHEITQAIQEIDSATQQNSQVANQSSSRAEELRNQSDILSNIVVEMEHIVYGNNYNPSKKTPTKKVHPRKVEKTPKLKIVNTEDSIEKKRPTPMPKEKVATVKKETNSLNGIPSADDDRFEDII